MSNTGLDLGPSDLLKPLKPIWSIGKFIFNGVQTVNKANERENKRSKKREQIEIDKSELQKIGLGDIDSVRMAMRQGHITYDNYKEIMAILER